MKRQREFDGGGDPRPAKKGGGKGRIIDMPFVLKFLAPEQLASAVIGKGGAVIAQMRQSTGAKIAFTEHYELYPGTDCRVLTSQAESEDALADLANQICGKVAECVQAGASESLGEPGMLKLRTLAPRAAVGGIIGKGGAAIKQLREESSAKVSVGEAAGPGPQAEQVITLQGTQQALEHCIAEVNRQVQALSSEPWFVDWASNTGVVPGGSGKGVVPGGNGKGGGALGPPMSFGGGKSSKDGGGKGFDKGGGRGFDARGPPPRADFGPPGLGMLIDVAQSLPQYVMEDSRGFALSCVVPNKLVGGLIGRGGSGTKEIQGMTGTKIGIREIPGDPENRSLNISGPLSSSCAAYMLMMKRYLDAESADSHGPPAMDDGRKGCGKGRR